MNRREAVGTPGKTGIVAIKLQDVEPELLAAGAPGSRRRRSALTAACASSTVPWDHRRGKTRHHRLRVLQGMRGVLHSM